MHIKRHKKSHIVKLSDNTVWHIWPGDLDKTLAWLPTTEIELVEIDHEVCSHALVDRSSGLDVKVSSAGAKWRIDHVQKLLGHLNGHGPH